MEAMITYKFKSQTKNGYIPFTGDKIEVKTLKKEIAAKSGSKEEELVLDDEQTGDRYKDSDFVKSFSVIVVERVNPLSFYASLQNATVPTINQPNRQVHSDAVHEMLESLAEKARFFMIKSSNEDNIRIAKEHGIWATTFINQRKLKDAYDDVPNVILFFKANSSNNLQGLARMQEKPSDTPNKSVWVGVETIKLGGNFRIKWLSRSIVAGNKFEHEINPMTKEYVSRSGDVQEIERNLGKKMAYLFDLPNEPELSNSMKMVPQKPDTFINIDEILNPSSSSRPKPEPASTYLPQILPAPLGVFPTHMPSNQLFAMFNKMNEMMYINMKNRDNEAKESKIKEKSKAKESESSSSSESSDSESERRKKKHRKERKSKKEKKSRKSRHKERSRSRNKNRDRSHHKKRK